MTFAVFGYDHLMNSEILSLEINVCSSLWCKNVSVRAFEFGASPYPETRRHLLLRPRLFEVPTYLIVPANQMVWVRYVMGVFAGITESGDLSVSSGKARLVGARGVIGQIDLHDGCASATREEMNQ
jgi:hypothetical protein